MTSRSAQQLGPLGHSPDTSGDREPLVDQTPARPLRERTVQEPAGVVS